MVRTYMIAAGSYATTRTIRVMRSDARLGPMVLAYRYSRLTSDMLTKLVLDTFMPQQFTKPNASRSARSLFFKMMPTASKIRFKAKLFRPAAAAKAGSWTFLTLPKDASAKLPSRGMTTVEGTINGYTFQATLEPDGQKSHWLRVNRKLHEAAGADPGDIVTLEI